MNESGWLKKSAKYGISVMLIRVVMADMAYLAKLGYGGGGSLSSLIGSTQLTKGIKLSASPSDKRKGLAVLQGVDTMHGLMGLKMMNKVVNLGFFFNSLHDRAKFIMQTAM